MPRLPFEEESRPVSARLLGSLGATLIALSAQAHDPAAARAAAAQKIPYVERLLEDEASARRIAEHPAASREQAAARENLARARERLRLGEPEAALRAVDEALRAAMAARRLAPDRAQAESLERASRERRMQNVAALLAAMREQHERTPSPQAAAAIERAAALLAQGKAQEAERLLGTALDQFLTLRTIDYTPRFASAEEEYAHELQRVRALGELVPVAIATLRPEPEAEALVRRHAGAAAEWRAAAERSAALAEHPAALAALREASVLLQRALAAAGVALP
jgi:hypothetical protein